MKPSNSYFINDQDQIKKISNPEEDFVFKINTNDRYNEMQKEAMNSIYISTYSSATAVFLWRICMFSCKKQRRSYTACVKLYTWLTP